MGRRISLGHLNHVCFGRCGSSAYRVSAAGSAQDNPAMTGFDFGDDLAELTLSKLLPYKLLFRSRRAQCPSLQFELAYRFRIGRLYSSFKGDSGLTPNAPMSGGGARSAEESAPLAG